MMSVSLAASCLRMANISSCLRMALAFSTPVSSAKLKSSVGDLTLRSCSFISLTTSCIRNSPDGLGAWGWDVEMRGAGRKEGKAEWRSGRVTGPQGAPAAAEQATPARLGRRQGGDEPLYSKIHWKTKGIVEPLLWGALQSTISA